MTDFDLLVSSGGESLLVSPGGEALLVAPGAEGADNGDGGATGSRRRRWVVRVGKRLIEFATAAEAIAAAEALRDAEALERPPTKPAAKKPAAAKRHEPAADLPAPAQTVYLEQVKAMARRYDEMAAYRQAMQRQQYAAVLALFERLQDEEDVEQLLLCCV